MEKYKRNPNWKCKECDREIYKRPNEIKRGSIFCSIKCSNIRRKKPDIPCIICGAIIPRRKHAKTCSRECSNKNRIGISYGKGRPRDKAFKIRQAKDRLIEDRGGYCNRCGFDKKEILQVHHIIEKSNNGTDEPSNLELLCPNCHCLHHFLTKTKIERIF